MGGGSSAAGGEGALSPPDPRVAVRPIGVTPRRRLSQSFLRRPSVAQALVRAAGLEPGDTVLEVGPGLGIVTGVLVQRAARVVAIELDRKLAEALPEALGSPENLTVVQGDALRVDLAELIEEPYTVVASLPYHVATPILFRLAFQRPRPYRIVAMLQEEVARRLVPPRGVHTYLEIAFATVVEARIVGRVPPQSFFPVPKVRSAIVRLDFLGVPRLRDGVLEGFLEFVRAGFAHPRQQLHNSLAGGLRIPATVAAAAARSAAIEPTRRPGELGLEEWARLHQAVQTTVG